MEDIFKTINELEQSLRLSHNTERMIFQNEIQLQLDKHYLEYELDKEKLKNSRLRRLSGFDVNCHNHTNRDDQNEVKILKTKCLELTAIVKKRSNQLFKALAQIKDLKADKERLKSKLKGQNVKIKEMQKEHADILEKMEQELDTSRKETEKAKQAIHLSDVQVALQQQMKRNKLLMYNNYQLKTQIAYSRRVEKFSVSTQVSVTNFFSNNSDDEKSG